MSQWRTKRPPLNIPNVDVAVGKVNIMPFLMIGGVVIGIFALLNGSKLGFAAIIACLAGLALSLAVVKYASILAIGGLVGSVGTLIVSLFNKQVGLIITTAKRRLKSRAD